LSRYTHGFARFGQESGMSPNGYLTLYCVLILIGALAGAYLPFFGHMTHGKLQIYLSTAAGVMLGASFFHIMPDAMELAGPTFGWFMALGAVGLFGIERFIAPHSHEVSKPNGEKHDHKHHDEHGCEHGHDHTEFAKAATLAKEPHPAAPSVAGWAAVLGLTIHTFMNGFGLGGAG